jgi:hypothetical protein
MWQRNTGHAKAALEERRGKHHPVASVGMEPAPIDARALLFAFRRFVTRPGSSVRVRSPIGSGSAFADELLLRF